MAATTTQGISSFQDEFVLAHSTTICIVRYNECATFQFWESSIQSRERGSDCPLTKLCFIVPCNFNPFTVSHTDVIRNGRCHAVCDSALDCIVRPTCVSTVKAESNMSVEAEAYCAVENREMSRTSSRNTPGRRAGKPCGAESLD